MNSQDAVYMTSIASFDNRGMSQRQDKDDRLNQSAMIIAAALDCMQSPTSIIDPYALMGIRKENLYGNLEMGNYSQIGGVPAHEMVSPPMKEIKLKNCVLYPPNPNAPRPTTRGRPLGCKTIFVDGLPDKITDEIIKEIFEPCGTVETIRRRARRNFCDVRFSDESCVVKAVHLSGYLLKIGNKDDPPYTGRLHIDYAKNRDDEHDFECKQRALQRQTRHQEADSKKRDTRPLIFYPCQVTVICDMLKNEDSFTVAASSLITWLEKGDCNKKTSSYFFSMIQSAYKQVKRLQLDKVKYENELNEVVRQLQFEKVRYENQLNQAMRSLQFEKLKYKDQLNQTKQILNFSGRKAKLTGILLQFSDIEKIYKAASLQKCWDHFTKAQRKNIETWKEQIEELKNNFKAEVVDVGDEEIVLNNEIDSYSMDVYVQQLKDQYNTDTQKLREEIDALKSQLNVAQNELFSKSNELKQNQTETESLKSQLKAAQNALKTQSDLLKQKLAEIEQIKMQFTEEKQKIQEGNVNLNNMCIKYEADLKQLDSKFSTAQNEINIQAEMLKQKQAEIEQMKKQFEDEIVKLQEEKLGLNCKIFMYEAELKEYHAYKRKKTKENNDSDYENSHSRSSSNVNLLRDARLIGLISAFLHMHSGGADTEYICSYLYEIDPSIDSRDVENLLERYPAFFKEKSRGSGSKLTCKKWYFTGF